MDTDDERIIKRIHEDAGAVIRFITERAREPEYGLVMSQYFNGRTGEWLEKRCCFDDIGDYLIFIVWYGMLSGRDDCVNFAREQVEIWNRFFRTKHGFYVDEYIPGERKRPKSVYMYGHQDAFVGLRMLYELTGDEMFLNSLKELSDATVNLAISGYGLIKNCFLPDIFGIPFFRVSRTIPESIGTVFHRPAVDGIICEEMMAVSRITGNGKYLNAARDVLESWCSLTVFERTGMFPDHVVPLLKFSVKPKSSIMKTNTNMISALLRASLFYRSMRHAACKALDAMCAMRREDGVFYSSYDPVKRRICDDSVKLHMNHSAVMVLIDAYRILKDDQYLEVADECISWYLNRMNKKTGLVPDGDSINAKLDSISDFFVNVIKMYEITGEDKYLDMAKYGFFGISKYYRTDVSFVKVVDSSSGRVVNEINETKYLGGYLKFITYLYYILKGNRAYVDDLMWDMIRDR